MLISIESGTFLIEDENRRLEAHQRNQLDFWQFHPSGDATKLIGPRVTSLGKLVKVLDYFNNEGVKYVVSSELQQLLQEYEDAKGELTKAKLAGDEFKQNKFSVSQHREFIEYVKSNLKRKLKSHQLKSASHLLHVRNGANFSVPGSGKTTVILAVYAYLKAMNTIDTLFVIGPPSCFGPWMEEYTEVIGCVPNVALLSGGNVSDRYSVYLDDHITARDLYLTSFQTFRNDLDKVSKLLSNSGLRFFVVVDEAHYIKQLGGTWAKAVLSVSEYASRRSILTGTPLPNSLEDAYNLFEFLWPNTSIISQESKLQIRHSLANNDIENGINRLDSEIGPFFYRVRKAELKLARQVHHEPTIIEMNLNERTVYDALFKRMKFDSLAQYHRDAQVLDRLRKGRIMRLRQCVSYTGLLSKALGDYDLELLEDKLGIANTIHNYDNREHPAKLEALTERVSLIKEEGNRVIIWSNFIGTLDLIVRTLVNEGLSVLLVMGATPTFKRNYDDDEQTRREIFAEFNDPLSEVDALVANPAVCSESVSLHTSCFNAIYYDLSYNCAQYLQSLDRIHRVGASETRESNYYYLLYNDTIEFDIFSRIHQKAETMSAIVDKDYAIYDGLDLDSNEELLAYERLFHDN